MIKIISEHWAMIALILTLILQFLWWAFKEKLEGKQHIGRQITYLAPIPILTSLLVADKIYAWGFYPILSVFLMMYTTLFALSLIYQFYKHNARVLNDWHAEFESRLSKLEKEKTKEE